MNQGRIIIGIALLVILAVIAFIAIDFFGETNDSTKNIYEYKLDKFDIIDPELINYKEIYAFSPNINQLRGIAIDEDDLIYVTGLNKILVFEADGKQLSEIITSINARCVHVSENKQIFLGAKDHIEVWSPEGEQLSIWPTINDKAIITSITSLPSGVFVADAGNKIIHRYDLEGNIINEIGKKDPNRGIIGFVIPSPYFDLAIGRDDELWAVNSGHHQLESYDEEGNLKSSWKKTSMNLDGFSGCCNPSHISILSDGSFVTSEKGLVRVKIHAPNGEFASVVAGPELFEKGTKGLDLAVDSKDNIYILDPNQKKIRVFQKMISNNNN